ncbi:MAG: hypothetical protein QOG20_2025 [Pseudonocardiales bacterium]|jgi:hypothetical protein|nr:hypothetical protein [Pseudonocardiales bacterium]
MDSDPDGLGRLQSRTTEDDAAVEIRLGRFEDQTWPQADLVNASLTLGWCAADEVAALGADRASLSPGGRFAGQLHGDRDIGGGLPTATRLSRTQVDALFTGWEVELFEESEKESVTPFGVPKNLHLFDVITRAPATDPPGDLVSDQPRVVCTVRPRAQLPLDRALGIRTAGFDAVALSVHGVTEVITPDTPPAEAAEIGDLITGYGLDLGRAKPLRGAGPW